MVKSTDLAAYLWPFMILWALVASTLFVPRARSHPLRTAARRAWRALRKRGDAR